MKSIIIGSVITLFAVAACNDNKENKVTETHTMNHEMSDSSMGNQMGGTGTMSSTNGKMSMHNSSMSTVMKSYLQVENALANDDAKTAATAGNDVALAIANLDVSGFTSEQKKMYEDVKSDIQEHGEHIGSNANKIAHQREHFETLSQDIHDLVKATGAGQAMYYYHCPMYNNNKGANWLSDSKQIKNPYLGKKMSDCGEMKEELK
ncbi:MAG: DUF3347 domain-containing protein [Chitinophagaceae bacterium]